MFDILVIFTFKTMNQLLNEFIIIYKYYITIILYNTIKIISNYQLVKQLLEIIL